MRCMDLSEFPFGQARLMRSEKDFALVSNFPAVDDREGGRLLTAA